MKKHGIPYRCIVCGFEFDRKDLPIAQQRFRVPNRVRWGEQEAWACWMHRKEGRRLLQTGLTGYGPESS
jgi:hypothetical protein